MWKDHFLEVQLPIMRPSPFRDKGSQKFKFKIHLTLQHCIPPSSLLLEDFSL